MIQGSQEWLEAKAGRFSASKMKDLLGSETARRSYLMKLLAQRLGVEDAINPIPQTRPMRWGVEHEQQAKDHYWAVTGNTVIDHPGQTHPDMDNLWCSPDGLVGKRGMVEIKCPNSDTHLKTILGDCCPPEHFPQIQTGILVFGLEWSDFISFDPRNPVCPIFISRVERDEELIGRIITAVENGEKALQAMMATVREAAL